MLQRTLLACSFLILSGCGVKPPEGKICLYDAPRERSLCYDVAKDLDSSGRVKPDAKMLVIENVKAETLDKHTHFDPESWSNVRKWMQKTRDRLEQCR